MTSLATLEDRPEHAEVVVTYATKVIGQSDIKEMDKAHLLYQRGRANVVLQKSDEAIADFAAAAKALPDQLSFRLELADAYARVGKSDEAIKTFEAAIKSFPDVPVVYNNRGMFLQRQGKPAEAIADFTQALELNPKFYFALTNRGFSLLKSGDAAAAENDLTATLKLNSNQPRAYGLRASARLSLGRIEEGIADHEKSVELDPKNPIAWADLGYARFFAGRYADSVKAFDKAIELDEGRRYLNPWRYLAMAKAGDGEAAKEKFAKLIQADASKRDWIDHLLVFLSGQIDGDTLIKSVNTQPSVKTAQLCEAHFFIAEMQEMTGETDAAAEHFKMAIDTGAKQLAAYRGASFALKKVATSSGSN
jgi:lipoprotein NlpI